jgi:hypothetical protein
MEVEGKERKGKERNFKGKERKGKERKGTGTDRNIRTDKFNRKTF